MPRVGDVVAGKFVIERLIGQGGMGAVFAARHRDLDSVVALKVMLADTSNAEATARFKNEGRAAAKIRSEHVVRVEDVGEENGYAYMILELLDGEDLSQVLERVRRMPPSDVVACMLEACEGVRRAHEKSIIHRDLKPSNLFVTRNEDGSKVVKVLDFGISKSQSTLAQAPASLTSTKAMLGSPLYMSPEQLRSSKSVDVRADIWALGVIMYELLSGTLPYMGESLGELFAAILETDPTPLRTRAPEVPQELEDIVMRCLQRRPENRFQSVSEVSQALFPLAQAYATGGLPAVNPAEAVLGPMNTKVLSSLAASSQPALPYRQSYGTNPGVPGPHRPMAPSIPGQITGQTTGSGAYIPVVKGTAPLGSVTPQPHLQGGATSQPSWQNTGGTAGGAARPKNVGMILGLVAAAAVVLVGAGVVLMRSSKSGTSESPVSSTTAAITSTNGTTTSLATTPTEPVDTLPSPTPSGSAAPSAQAPTADSAEPALTSIGLKTPEPKAPTAKPGSESTPRHRASGTTKSTAEKAPAEPTQPKTSQTSTAKSSKPATGGLETGR